MWNDHIAGVSLLVLPLVLGYLADLLLGDPEKWPHMGRTTGSPESVNSLLDGTSDGCWLSNGCYGTYMHGIFDNRTVVDSLIAPFTTESATQPSYADFKEQEYNRLADHFRKNLDMEKIYNMLMG